MIITSGTLITDKEKQYALQAVEDLNNPSRFRYFIDKFEEEFAKYLGVKYALTTPTGTSALHLSVIALGIGKGDEVIVPDLAFVALANAISYTGAKVVPVDVRIDNWTIEPEEIDDKITKKTKAIATVYMYGRRPDRNIKERFGLPVLEDACPAVGTKDAGTLGDVAAFSFQGAKTIAIGEGGMLVTNRKDLYDKAKHYGNVCKTDSNFNCDAVGYNYRMSNIQAAIGLAQLENVEALIEARMRIHKWYGDYCMQTLDKDEVCWQNSYLAVNREKFREYLKTRDIDTRAVFPTISSYPMYKALQCPVSKTNAELGVNLPSAAYLTRKEIDYVKSCIETYHES